MSRLFSTTEVNYTVYRKEILALIHFLKACEIFIKFQPIFMESDCRSILWLKSSKSSSDVLIRYACILTSYQLNLKHVPGNQNISDALSRSREYKDNDEDVPPMGQKEAEILISALTLPANTTFTANEIKDMLQGTGLPSLIASRMKGKKG